MKENDSEMKKGNKGMDEEILSESDEMDDEDMAPGKHGVPK
jgi:hypothetical protein